VGVSLFFGFPRKMAHLLFGAMSLFAARHARICHLNSL
jgi:hypothetical protein